MPNPVTHLQDSSLSCLHTTYYQCTPARHQPQNKTLKPLFFYYAMLEDHKRRLHSSSYLSYKTIGKDFWDII